jgi:sensor domain CHASE-containing protein
MDWRCALKGWVTRKPSLLEVWQFLLVILFGIGVYLLRRYIGG